MDSTFSTATANGKDAILSAFDARDGSVTHYDAQLIATLRKYEAQISGSRAGLSVEIHAGATW